MNKSKVVILCAALLMFSAGIVVGRLPVVVPKATVPAVVTPPATQPGRRDVWISQLNLTADQRTQMDGIWSGIKPEIEKTFEDRRAAEKVRDDAIQKLLSTSELQTDYDKILSDYHTARTKLDDKRGQLIHDAEEKSRGLLDADQQKKWDVLSKHNRDTHGGHRPTTQRSSTRPDNDGQAM